jgi:hypothetical protein
VDAASKLGWLPDINTWLHLRKFRDKLVSDRSRQVQNSDALPTTSDLRTLHTKLRDIAVVSSLDRNAGCLFVEYPVAHHSALSAQFLENVATYEHVSDKYTAHIISCWRTLGKKWAVPGIFYTGGSLPYAYVNRKNKDTNRCRSIVAFSNAPHLVQLRYCARSFYFIIKQIRVNTFTLWTAHDFRDPILLLIDKLRNSPWANGYDISLVGVASDVKDMYSNLEHRDIMSAVAWALSVFRKQFRRDRVNVARR